MNIGIVGAGITGSTLAALARDGNHEVTIYEKEFTGGLACDYGQIQRFGPHAFHTDDDEVWEFLQPYVDWEPFCHEVRAMEPSQMAELPRRHDPVFKHFSEKAWGIPFEELPESTRNRVPSICTDGRVGYLAGKHKARPVGGYSNLCETMIGNVRRRGQFMPCHEDLHDVVFYTGDFGADIAKDKTELVCRKFGIIPAYALPYDVVNYCTPEVPLIRAWNQHAFTGKPEQCVGFEWFAANPSCRDVIPCYPPIGEYQNYTGAWVRNIYAVGRMAERQYYDMDQCVRAAMECFERVTKENK